jgi:hypothetical protein
LSAAVLPSSRSIPAEVLDAIEAPLGRLVLMAINGHAFGEKDTAYPSYATLARKVGRSAGHVRRVVYDLVRAGTLGRRRARNGTGWEFVLPWKAAKAPPQPPPDLGARALRPPNRTLRTRHSHRF